MYLQSAPATEIVEGATFMPKAPRLMQVLDAVSDVYRIGKRDLMGPCRLAHIAAARHAFYWVARHVSLRSYESIAKFLNGRHHTTVLHGVRKVSAHFDVFKRKLILILAALGIDTSKLVGVALGRL